MDTRQLEYFIALASWGSFTRAADALCITQSALSKSIIALEDALGSKLVDRLGRIVVLTPVGERVLVRAKSLVVDTDNLIQDVVRCRDEMDGVFRLGLGAGPGASMGVALIEHFTKTHPSLRLKIRRGDGAALVHDVRERYIDALIVDSRSVTPSSDLQIEPLGVLQAGAICRPKHPLAAEKEVTFDQILRYPIFSTSVTDEVSRLLVTQFGMWAEPRQSVRIECEELEMLVGAVMKTDGIFLGVIAAAAEAVHEGTLTLLPVRPAFDPSISSIPIASVRLAARSESAAEVATRHFAKQFFTHLPWFTGTLATSA